MNGFIYAIQSGEAIKIGFAKNPIKRLAQISVGSPDRQQLIGYISGTMQDEKRVHQDCKAHAIRG